MNEVWESVSAQEAPTRPVRVSSEGLLARWIAETSCVAERAAAGSSDALSLFWIRLYGMLTEVADFVALTLDDALARDGLCAFPLARVDGGGSPLPSVMALLKSSFDEDELLYIEYRRHTECDPLQTKYRARRRPLSTLVPSVLLDGRPVYVEYADAAIRRLLDRHEGSEQRLGEELARRALSVLCSMHPGAL